jgi:predicted esterase
LVILAHGGSEQADRPARDWHSGLLRVLRLGDVAAEAAPYAAVGLLRYRVSGWNGASADPARDVLQVIEAAQQNFERMLLIGHSMGGRAVLRASCVPGVCGVLALAPWVPSDEPNLQPCDVPVVIATGTSDETTTADETRRFVERSRKGGCRIGYLEIAGAGHRLLMHAKEADHLVRSFVSHALGTGDELIGSLISADDRRPPDLAPTQVDAWRYISGTRDNLISILGWKRRGSVRVV